MEEAKGGRGTWETGCEREGNCPEISPAEGSPASSVFKLHKAKVPSRRHSFFGWRESDGGFG